MLEPASKEKKIHQKYACLRDLEAEINSMQTTSEALHEVAKDRSLMLEVPTNITYVPIGDEKAEKEE